MATSGATSASSIGDTGIRETNTWTPSIVNANSPDNANRYIGLRAECPLTGSVALTDLIQTSEPSGEWWKCLECSHLFRHPDGANGVDPVVHMDTAHGIDFSPHAGSTQAPGFVPKVSHETRDVMCASCGGQDPRCGAHHPEYFFACILPPHSGPHYDPNGGHWDERGQLTESRTVTRMVTEFHETFNVAIARFPTPALRGLRARLILEESCEAITALDHGELPDIAQELADLAYVTYGAAISLGIDLDVAIAAVHGANMSKLGANGNPVMRDDGKVLKGENYQPPDMSPAIRPDAVTQ